MSIAEELAAKYITTQATISANGTDESLLEPRQVEVVCRRTAAAINEALELAAREAETKAATRCTFHQRTGKGACGYEIAFNIRALKSPAQEPESG